MGRIQAIKRQIAREQKAFTYQRIIEITQKEGEFAVGPLYRHDWLRDRCHKLAQYGYLRLYRTKSAITYYRPSKAHLRAVQRCQECGYQLRYTSKRQKPYCPQNRKHDIRKDCTDCGGDRAIELWDAAGRSAFIPCQSCRYFEKPLKTFV